MASSPRVDNIKKTLLIKGAIIDGQFTILDYLGHGSTGVVYHAIDNETQDDVAIKVIHPALMEALDNKRHLIEIATLHQQFQHPNIVPIISVHQNDKYCFIIMPLMKGQTLRQLINKQQQSQHAFSVNQVVEIISAITSGLNTAHAYAAHQNIKPENIWITEQGRYTLMDMGLATLQTSSEQTRSGVAIGTAAYLAPEQLKGAAADNKADQYSLAIIAYELLTGDVPSRNIEPLSNNRNDIPKRLEFAILKALSFQDNNRFVTTAAFYKAIEGSRRTSFLSKHPFKIIFGIALASVVFYSLNDKPSHDIIIPAPIPVTVQNSSPQDAILLAIINKIQASKQKLKSAQITLNTTLREAQNNHSPSVASLKFWKEITKDKLFTNQKIQSIEDDFASGLAMQKEQHYAQAKLDLNKTLTAYQLLLQEFVAAKELYQTRQIIEHNQQTWLEISEKNMIAQPIPKKIEDLISQAETNLNQGKFQLTLSNYQQANKYYQTAVIKQQTQAKFTAETIEQKEAERLSNERLVLAQQQVLKLKKEQDKQQRIDEQSRLLAEQEQRKSKQFEHKKLAAEAKQAQIMAQQRKDMIHNLVGTMIAIPRGQFKMGCSNTPECLNNEKPSHLVSVSSFKIGQTELTRSHYQHCITAGACPDTARGLKNHPVTNISYNDITQHYIPWLNTVTGEHFRLPSEAEWEYAARAGSSTLYSWGDNIDCSKAHYNGGENSACYYKLDGKLRGTVAVATYTANDFGLFDMHGNVWEWIQDCWHNNYNGSPINGKAWAQENCKQHVARGGSWVISPDNLRITYRNKYNINERNGSFGFRLVQEIK